MCYENRKHFHHFEVKAVLIKDCFIETTSLAKLNTIILISCYIFLAWHNSEISQITHLHIFWHLFKKRLHRSFIYRNKNVWRAYWIWPSYWVLSQNLNFHGFHNNRYHWNGGNYWCNLRSYNGAIAIYASFDVFELLKLMLHMRYYMHCC